ncbi:TPA: hypothetical protein EYP27_00475, partial [Candidatus Bathyarchaeota archaeon]|nr:hypothetical protein [Candidatus Bathyarchaeota archaeon]
MSEQHSLDRFLGKEEAKPEKEETKGSDWIERLKKNISRKAVPAKTFTRAYLLSATYDGNLRCTVLKFYEPVEGKIVLWHDTTKHKPYCFTSLTPEELKAIPEVIGHEGVEDFEIVERHNPLTDSPVRVTRILARDPLTIGGRPGSLRELIPRARADAKVWEADIKYYENYLYDL